MVCEQPFGDKAGRWQFPVLGGLPTLGEALQALQQQGMTSPHELFAGLADPLAGVVAAARAGVLGREMTFRMGRTEITLTIVDLDVRSTPTGLAVGQYEDVRLIAERVTWGGTHLRRLTVRCHNVHLRTGTTTALVAAPIEMEAVVDQEEINRWLRARARWIRLTIDADGVARVMSTDRPEVGQIEVSPRMDGTAVRLVPTALVLRGRRLPLHQVPGWRLPLARLPQGALMNGVKTGPGQVSISAIVPQWRQSLSPAMLRRLAERLRARRSRVDVPPADEPEPSTEEPP